MNTQQDTLTSTYVDYFFRTPYLIGQDSKDLTFRINNWSFGSSGYAGASNPINIVDMSLESPDGTVILVTFNGGDRGVTIAPVGSVFTDFLMPSAFSLSTFLKSSTAHWWLKGHIQFDATAGKICNNNNTSVGDVTNSQVGYYDPAVTTISSMDSSGKYTFTGTAPFNRVAMFVPIMLGHPVTHGPSWLMVGDSIGGGQADTGNDAIGKSFFNRALYVSSSDFLPGLNLSTGGTNTSHYLDEPHVMDLYQYARFAAENHAANELSSIVLATAQTRHLALWQNFRDSGIERVLAVEPFARTTSTDVFITAANQSYLNAAWSPDGVVDQYEAWLQTQIDGIILDGVVQTDVARDPDFPRKWKSDGVVNDYTADGLHPRLIPNQTVGVVMRTLMNTFS